VIDLIDGEQPPIANRLRELGLARRAALTLPLNIGRPPRHLTQTFVEGAVSVGDPDRLLQHGCNDTLGGLLDQLQGERPADATANDVKPIDTEMVEQL